MPLRTDLFPSCDATGHGMFAEQRMPRNTAGGERPRGVEAVTPRGTEAPLDSRSLPDVTGQKISRLEQTVTRLLDALKTDPSDQPGSVMQKLMKILRSVFGRKVGPEQQQQNPDAQVDQIVNDTRTRIPQVLGREGANRLSEGVRSAVRDAQNRFGLSPEEYQKKVMMAPGESETAEKFCRPLLSQPAAGARELVLMTGGNNEPLTQEQDRRGSQRGQMYMYDKFATEKPAGVDVLQFRVGKLTADNPAEQNSVASIHIQNIVNDALAGRGQFAGRKYTSVKMFGYSYGGGHSLLLADQLAQRKAAGENIPPVTQTAFVDAIEFQSVPPKAVNRQPASGQHLQVWQKGRLVDIHGGPVGAPGSNVTQRPIDGTTHQNINDARQQTPLFDEIYGRLKT
jgi:hypothetical protein